MTRLQFFALAAALLAPVFAQDAQICQPVVTAASGSCQQPYGGIEQWAVADNPCQGYCCPSGWQCRYNPANGASQNNRVCVAVVTAVPEAQPGAGSNGGGGGGAVNTVVRTNIVTVTGQPPQGGGGQQQQPAPTAQPQPQGGGGVVYYTTVIQGPSASIGVVMSTTYIVDGNAATTVVTIWGGKFAWKNYVTPCGQNTNAPNAISGVWLVGCSATDYNAATPGKTLIVPGALGPIFAVLIVLVTAITLWI